MSEMIERVARKMFADSSFYGEKDPDEIVERRLYPSGALIREPAWKAFEAAAHTAIEAMREPTEAMIAGAHRAWDRTHHGPGPFTIERMWRGAIDAALVSERGAEK